LTDHYNPADKTVNLSEAVYNERNAAAAAVAAHEVGHAVQHANAYNMLKLRSQLVPVVNVASGMSTWIVLIGLMMGAAAKIGAGYYIAVAGLVLMAVVTLFSFITLPVEYDASNRALAWLKNKNMLSPQEYEGAEDSLKWAARTYVVAAIGSLAMLVYWGFRVFGGSRER
jgi:Zn-dependent membrane protease YugP